METELRQLLDEVPAIVWSTPHPHSEADYYNQRWADYTGTTPEGGWVDWYAVVHPEERDSLDRKWQHALQTGTPFEHEHRILGKDGTYRWFLARAVPRRNEAGEVVRWVGSALDIHEKRELREQRLILADAGLTLSSDLDLERTLQNLAHIVVPRLADWCAIDIGDDHGRLQRVAVVHTDPAKVALGHEVERLYPTDPDAAYGRYRVWKTGVVESAYVITDEMLVGHARDERHLEILHELGLRSYICVPLSARGNHFGTLTLCQAESLRVFNEQDESLAEELGRRAGVAIDNARLHAQSAQLAAAERAARADAERAGRLKDEFLATLSHELRTPLNTMLGWSQLLLGMVEADSDVHQGLQVIARSVRTQARIVQDLLDMSRIASGKLHVQLEAMDLSAAVRSVLADLLPEFSQANVQLQAQGPDQAQLMGDPTRIQQILQNLLSNALKFSRPGGLVRVTWEEVDSSWQLSVEDNGQGIDPAFLPHIWDRFRQEDGSISRRHGGLGLGLSIVSQLVAAHQGSIRAESGGPDRGCLFVVRLPRGTPSQKVDEPPAAPPALAGQTILVTDDDADARNLTCRVLRESTAVVYSAGSVDEALRLFREHRPELVISDIGMPGRDGYELIRELRTLDANVPAIALTAFAREEDRQKALDAGYSEHVTKPVLPQTLLNAVEKLLGARELAS